MSQRQIDEIENEIVNALAGARIPRFRIPVQPQEAIVMWRQFVSEITGSHEAFAHRFARRIETTSGGRIRLQRDGNPPWRFRGMEGLYFKLVDQSSTTKLQFFVGDYSPIFRGFTR